MVIVLEGKSTLVVFWSSYGPDFKCGCFQLLLLRVFSKIMFINREKMYNFY